jgi:hypothetical protein
MKLQGQRGYANTWLVKDQLWDLKFCRKIPEDSLGITDPSTKTVYVKQKQDRRELFFTFIHEMLHTIEDEYGFDLPHKDVYLLEEAIGRFILDNIKGLERIFADP